MILFLYWLIAFFALILMSKGEFDSGGIILVILIVAPVLFPALLIKRIFK